MSWRTNRMTGKKFTRMPKFYPAGINGKTVSIKRIVGGIALSRLSPEIVDWNIAKIRSGIPIQPLLVQDNSDGTYRLVDGNHRRQAMKLLGVKNAKVILV